MARTYWYVTAAREYLLEYCIAECIDATILDDLPTLNEQLGYSVYAWPHPFGSKREAILFVVKAAVYNAHARGARGRSIPIANVGIAMGDPTGPWECVY